MSIGHAGRHGADIARANNLLNTSVDRITGLWADANGNYTPDCDLGDFAANGECGPISNQNFGGRITTTTYADDVLRGLEVRDYNWDMTTKVQHQLTSAISVTVRLLSQLV